VEQKHGVNRFGGYIFGVKNIFHNARNVFPVVVSCTDDRFPLDG
jgi:hypothetical protein